MQSATAGIMFTVCAVASLMAQAESIPACDYDPKIANCSGKYISLATATAPAVGIPVNTPTPSCAKEINTPSLAEQVANAYRAYNGDPQAAGNLMRWAEYEVSKSVGNMGGDLAAIVRRNGAKTSHGNCVPLIASVPAGATVEGVRLGYYEYAYGGTEARCKPGADCGWAKFTYEPTNTHSDDYVYFTEFMNWSHDRSRVAYIAILYSGKKPTSGF